MGSNRNRPEPPPARGTQRARTVDFNNGAGTPDSRTGSTTSLQQGGSTTQQNPPARKLIVPEFPTHATQSSNFDGSRDALDDLRRNPSNASTRSLPTRPGQTSSQPPPSRCGPQVLRKPAPPPIPNKKPALLSKPSYSPNPPPQMQYRDETSRPQVPAPRRSVAERRPVGNFLDEDTDKPPLPPRTGTGLSTESNVSSRAGRGTGRNLMDDEPEDLGSLGRGWEVLQPGR